jgi:hypothetical protein
MYKRSGQARCGTSSHGYKYLVTRLGRPNGAPDGVVQGVAHTALSKAQGTQIYTTRPPHRVGGALYQSNLSKRVKILHM